ncbi:CHAT domain-containing protein [Millisia brevis]|uniref:CHAT domain-containing protein n=1 Tax=Millisia brevis TaxID=264148 RepID=UPI000A006BB1|nr:CHAT domain-containing protein [Millisia brevis]
MSAGNSIAAIMASIEKIQKLLARKNIEIEEATMSINALASSVHDEEILQSLDVADLTEACQALTKLNWNISKRGNLSKINGGLVRHIAKRYPELPALATLSLRYLESTGGHPIRHPNLSGILHFRRHTSDVALITLVAITNNTGTNDTFTTSSAEAYTVKDQDAEWFISEIAKPWADLPNHHPPIIQLYRRLIQYNIRLQDQLLESHVALCNYVWVLLRAAETAETEHDSLRLYMDAHRMLAKAKAPEGSNTHRETLLRQLNETCIALSIATRDPDYRREAIGSAMDIVEITEKAHSVDILQKTLDSISAVDFLLPQQTAPTASLRGLTKIEQSETGRFTIIHDDHAVEGKSFQIIVMAMDIATDGPETDISYYAEPPVAIETVTTIANRDGEMACSIAKFTVMRYAPIATVRVSLSAPGSAPFGYSAEIEIMSAVDPNSKTQILVEKKETIASTPASDPGAASLTILDQGTEWVFTATCESLGFRQDELLRLQVQSNPKIYVQGEIERIRSAYETNQNNLGLQVDRLAQAITQMLVDTRVQEYLESATNSGITSLSILTNDLTMPWELALVTKDGRSRHLAEQFDVSVYPYSGTLPEVFYLEAVYGAFKGGSGAEFSVKTDRFLKDKQKIETHIHPVPLHEVPLTRGQFLESWAQSNTGIWYLATDGRIDALTGRLELETDDPNRESAITLTDLCVSSRFPIGSLVFLNACNTSSTERSITGEITWAEQLLRSGAAGFIGTRWPVTETVARIFADEFFKVAINGEAVPSALRRARIAARDRTDGADPSWLAYSAFCYGNLTGTARTPPEIT